MANVTRILALTAAFLALTSASLVSADAKQPRAREPVQAIGLKADGGGTWLDDQCGAAGKSACDDGIKTSEPMKILFVDVRELCYSFWVR
jgi:uncharacterized ferredoxin-like protein